LVAVPRWAELQYVEVCVFIFVTNTRPCIDCMLWWCSCCECSALASVFCAVWNEWMNQRGK
jgi:hypothetical protein